MIWLAVAASALAAPPTFQELMDPASFPNPQFGMRVESVTPGSNSYVVKTTGAEVLILPKDGRVTFSQRIGHQRPLVTLHFAGPLEGLQVTHSGPGFARFTCDQPRLVIRINGDSLFMLHAQEPLNTRIERHMDTAWSASFGANHLLADEWGAYGLYCSVVALNDRFNPYGDTVASHELPADAVLWVAVCPPKPYDWDRSLKDNVVWHWSSQIGYPPDDELRRWKEHGNIVLLQSEQMLWKEWNLAFVPRLGDQEFTRVRDTLHDIGKKVIVYTSPFYFLKGTPMEQFAHANFALGTAMGENMDLFLAEITRVMKDYKPDGLYFDGQYMDNPAGLYALARHSREIVGEDGILEWHSTAALGQGQCSLPQADAYVDFILRGEGQATSYNDRDYLRFFVSGYNVHNSIGVLCNNDATGLTPPLANNILSVNARTHTLAAWLDRPDVMQTLPEGGWGHVSRFKNRDHKHHKQGLSAVSPPVVPHSRFVPFRGRLLLRDFALTLRPAQHGVRGENGRVKGGRRKTRSQG